MQVDIPGNCGNAPRHQIIIGIIEALLAKDLQALHERCAEDVRWEIAGSGKITGFEAIAQWAKSGTPTDSLKFSSVLTHGKEGSVDGICTDDSGASTHFSHVFQFASAGKNAKLKAVRSYFIPAAS